MRYGAMNFPILPVISELDAFAEMGFDYLELAMDPPMAHHRTIHEQRRDIKNRLERHGMGLVCHLPTFVYSADLTPALRLASVDEICRSLEVAAELGAEKAVLHPGGARGMAALVPEMARSLAFESLAAIVRAAARLQIPICIENMFPAYGAFSEPGEFDAVFTRFPDLAMTLDTGHGWVGDDRGDRLATFVRKFGPRIQHLHISDNHGRIDEHLAPGKGTIDFAALMSALKAAGYTGTVTLEIFEKDRAALIAGRETIDRCFREAPTLSTTRRSPDQKIGTESKTLSSGGMVRTSATGIRSPENR